MINLTVGLHVFANGTRVKILAMLSAGRLRVEEISTGAIFNITPGEVEFELPSPDMAVANQRLHTIDSAGRFSECPESIGSVAVERFQLIAGLLDRGALVKDIIKELKKMPGMSPSLAYRTFNRFSREQGPLCLVDLPRGRKLGSRSISATHEELIDRAINESYRGIAANQAAIIQKVHELCLVAQLKPPASKTIVRRIKARNPKELLSKKQGSKIAKQKYEVRGGKLLTSAPLELVQIDHGLVDCIIVDAESRAPLCRPWVTLAVDVHTRVVLGLNITLCYPSGMSVALCMSHMILPKHRWLKKIGMDGCEYPFYGIPKRIHVDNAKEFRSPILGAGCAIYGIKLTWRPPGTPHNGAHIERLIGTFMGKVHFLPGTTMSSIVQKGDYKPDKHAALTFVEFREWFVREVEIYHKSTHSELECPPLYKWEEAFKLSDGSVSNPLIVADSLKLLLDFMPLTRRVVSRSGIKMNNVEYYSPALKNFNNGTPCVVRYDPLSLRHIWVRPANTDHYIELSYSDMSLPDISIEEMKFLRKKLQERSNKRISQTEVLELKKTNKTLVAAAESKTRRVRAMVERTKLRRDKSHPLHDKAPRDTQAEKPRIDYSLKPVPFKVEE
ncbi:Mu transposase C-terminal domain-containing protein [Pseudomonas viciae]|uniref:Mu transposase C-terminal domain-containing protein n=1 Tax=Pseudomonas viciae TaxID=2505979 RepID=UPI002233F6E9|nr:Mu transposase C-terminal domain-containing protein [Pseudomonas viciae]UZE83998.1 Mu transposase C-terminal domain-containing protein [Pseudomonas viciae]